MSRESFSGEVGFINETRDNQEFVGPFFIDESGGGAPSDQTVSPTGIASGEVFGTITVSTPSNQTLLLTGITSAEAFGTIVVSAGLTIVLVGIVGPAYHDIKLTGNFDTGSIDPAYTQYKVEMVDGPDPRSVLLPFGTLEYTFLKVAPGQYRGLWSLTNAAGTTTAETQTTNIFISDMGVPLITVPNVVNIVGIPSGQAFGNITVGLQINPTGITSGEAFGTIAMSTGGIGLVLQGIPSQESFGTIVIRQDQNIGIVGIQSQEAFGVIAVSFVGSQIVLLISIQPEEAFGTITVSAPGVPGNAWPPVIPVITSWIRIPTGRS